MSGIYEFEIDGTTIATGMKPARGPFVSVGRKRWVEQEVLGQASPGTILTLIGESSQKWDLESRANADLEGILRGVYNGETDVLFKTPQDSTGFQVIMTKYRVEYKTPLHDSLFLCKFTLVRR